MNRLVYTLMFALLPLGTYTMMQKDVIPLAIRIMPLGGAIQVITGYVEEGITLRKAVATLIMQGIVPPAQNNTHYEFFSANRRLTFNEANRYPLQRSISGDVIIPDMIDLDDVPLVIINAGNPIVLVEER